MTCDLCSAGLANSEEGKYNHYKKYHAVIVKREYVKMNENEKKRIVNAFEYKNYKAFIVNPHIVYKN